MNIILLQDLDKVGQKHEVVTVKDGYGRNYLIPKGLAVIANKTNMSKLDDIKRKEREVLEARLSEFKAIAAKLEGQVLKIGAKAGTSGKIFGSVTNVQLASALMDQLSIDVDRRKIIIDEEVKELGTFSAKLDMHPDVDAKVTFEVIAE
ncbi:MAG: 50S ribosomal protein L9 [Bacteroidota bacterium]